MSDEKALHRAMMDEATGIDATYTPRQPVYKNWNDYWYAEFVKRPLL